MKEADSITFRLTWTSPGTILSRATTFGSGSHNYSEQMDELAKSGLKVVAFLICPKSPGLPWDQSIHRADPLFAAQYGEFAYQVVNRYHEHPAWSGLIAVWGGSSDVFGEHAFHAPEVQVPLLNAAYEGIKRADPRTIVISFNLSTSISTPRQWEDWFERPALPNSLVGLHTYPCPHYPRQPAYGASSASIAQVPRSARLRRYRVVERGNLTAAQTTAAAGQVRGRTVETTSCPDVNVNGAGSTPSTSAKRTFEESSSDPGLMTAPIAQPAQPAPPTGPPDADQDGPFLDHFDAGSASTTPSSPSSILPPPRQA
jgi:hypothetical protein